ncbi:MAG TPA: ISKra4 family transposase, partial [Elainellaceae cyanobacterium]
MTDQQAKQLGVTAYRQISPYLENCCLRVSANVSYAQAADDVKYLTGVYVAAKTQQRLVQRHSFAIAGVEESLKEVSVDGGKVRLRTVVGEPCVWKDYKAVATDEGVVMASYQDNDALVEWVNQQSIAVPLTALGDGHDGVWNIINQMSSEAQRREVLDWYHLVENLHKVGGSIK